MYSFSPCIDVCALFVYLFVFFVFLSPFPLIFLLQDFVGVSFANSHKTSLVHLGEQRDLKGLLQTLNATVIPITVS